MKKPLSELFGTNVAKTCADGNPPVTLPDDPPEGLKLPPARVTAPVVPDIVGFAVGLAKVKDAPPLAPMSE